jgi:carotenoid cleavage dioxygenase-like enzyme
VSFVTNFRSGRGERAIFDATDITRGPIARVILPQQVPTGTHAFWAPESMLGA